MAAKKGNKTSQVKTTDEETSAEVQAEEIADKTKAATENSETNSVDESNASTESETSNSVADDKQGTEETVSETAPAEEPETIECLFIKSKSETGFRRCGFGFTQAGAYYDIALFTESQLETLAEEPHLLIKMAEVCCDDLDGPFIGAGDLAD